jgi:hypothetical protein
MREEANGGHRGSVPLNEQIRDAGKAVFEYLAVHDPVSVRADLIIGFGHFDPAIPRRCSELFVAGVASRILFTGGVGAGSADLDMPEARFFRETARAHYPQIPDSAFLLEQSSTNTGENVTFSLAMLAAHEPLLRPGHELRSAVIVANPYRQRRVWLTCRKQMGDVGLHNAPPVSSFEQQAELFRAKGQDITGLLVGEVERLVRYGELGYMIACLPPPEIEKACVVLGRASGMGHG